MTKTENTAPKQADTEYMVLASDDDGRWREFGLVKAATANAAKREANKQIGDGTYVAVPARSWAPQTAVSQTKTVTEWT